jgi:hypothetical protein
VKLGYSYWGFLGPGIVDTPDGGRSHRRPLLEGLAERGHDVVLLQVNRDLEEAGCDLRDRHRWDAGLPDIDALMLEWRWPIAGRNTTPCGATGHTCDLHRQGQLLARYTAAGVPTVIWDKDRRLPADDPLRRQRHVAVCDAALFPTPGAHKLLFPVADAALETADPAVLAASHRPLPLVYIGNQYDRDDAFDDYFAPAASHLQHLVIGKWPHQHRWPHVTFAGRQGFSHVGRTYRSAIATVLLLPRRYAAAGQITQRLAEAVLAGCLPLAPPGVVGSGAIVPAALHVRDGQDVTRAVTEMAELVGSAAHAALLADCLAGLEPFRLSTQLDALDTILEQLPDASISTAAERRRITNKAAGT